MDWLLHWYRINSNKPQTSRLTTTYFTSNHNQKQERIFNLFKLLSFMKGRQKSETFLDEQVYYLVQAPLSQFIEYIGLTPTNHRHRTKTLSILHDLRTLEPILESFDDSEFRSSAAFPYFKIKKVSRAWIITIAIAKQIYQYQYPYQFKKYLLQSESQSHQQVQYFIIQAINTYSLEKRFLVHQFISQFNLSNQKVAQIRKYILELLQELVKSNIIDTQFKIINNSGSIEYSTHLTTKLIAQANQIYVEENIQYKTLLQKI